MSKWLWTNVLVLSCLLVSVPLFLRNCNAQEDLSSFIRVENGRFVDDDCTAFHPVGWNSWPIPLYLYAARAVQNDTWAVQYIETLFQTAKETKFNTFRVFGHGINEDMVLQTYPGVYNETVWQAIDYIIYQAGKHGIRAIISPSSNWQSNNGKDTYIKWANLTEFANGTIRNVDQFWTHPVVKTLYKNHLTTLLTRVNVFTGIAYRDDPAIFAWNLFNEYRCPWREMPPGCGYVMVQWVDEMSTHMKALDSNHMVTVGMEGFHASGSGREAANPTGSQPYKALEPINSLWASYGGQDSFGQHGVFNIDYVTIHMWPDNWATLDFNWAAAFLTSQLVVAAKLGRPLLLEEFGKQNIGTDKLSPMQVRNQWFKFWYNAIIKGQEAGSPLQGALFWMWMPYDVKTVGGSKGVSGTQVYINDPTWKVIERYTEKVNSLPRSTVVGCLPFDSEEGTYRQFSTDDTVVDTQAVFVDPMGKMYDHQVSGIDGTWLNMTWVNGTLYDTRKGEYLYADMGVMEDAVGIDNMDNNVATMIYQLLEHFELQAQRDVSASADPTTLVQQQPEKLLYWNSIVQLKE